MAKQVLKEFILPGPGLPSRNNKASHELDQKLVEMAMKELIGCLRDPHRYEALQHLLNEKHPLVSKIKPGRPFRGKGKLAVWIITNISGQTNKAPKSSKRGRKPLDRKGFDKLLMAYENSQDEKIKNKSLRELSKVVIKGGIEEGIYPKNLSSYSKKKLEEKLYCYLKNQTVKSRKTNR